MKLIDVVKNLKILDSELTIYAKQPWGVTSYCEVALEPEDGSYPEVFERKDLEYFIEIFIADEFVDGWNEGFSHTPTVEEQTSRLIQYAENDA